MAEVAKQVTPNLMQMVYDHYQQVLEASTPDEKRQALDRAIDESLASRDEMDQQLAGNSGTVIRSRIARRGPDGELIEGEANEVVDGTTPEGQRFMLDHTAPEQRAIMDAYVEALRARMKERGIDPRQVPIRIGIRVEREGPGAARQSLAAS